MKTYILAGFLLLAAGVAVYIVTSLRSVAGEKIKKKTCLRALMRSSNGPATQTVWHTS
jgi:hypothetical protein